MATRPDLHHNRSVIRHDARVLDPMEPRLFDVDWLRAEGHHRGSSTGRGEAHFLSFAGREMVLRPFRRGGMMGRINRNLYLRAGLNQSRSMKEFALLGWMLAQGLPVPRPIAAQVTPVGPLYHAALLTERIPGGHPMEEILQQEPLSADLWARVGAVIRRMHDAGVYHADLNCRNILIDTARQVWLIDFDKCDRRAPGGWAQDNLDRLLRSLRKSATLYPDLHWTAADWPRLLAGYGGGAEPP